MNMNFNVFTKEAINNELEKLSDFSKIYYLERLIHEKKDLTIKKICHTKLAVIYLEKGFHSKAAENMESIARLALSNDERIKAFMDEIKILTDGGDLQKAESVFEKVLSFANPMKKVELKKQFVQIYKNRAQILERTMKRANSVAIYERVMKIGDEIDKREAREKLLVLYPAIGKIMEYNRLKNG